MNFASDNAAPVAPEILKAIAEANYGAALAYGNDLWTRRVEQKLAALFEREIAAFVASCCWRFVGSSPRDWLPSR